MTAVARWEQVALRDANHIRLGFEIRPGFVADGRRLLLRLMAASGEATCANLDPSHLVQQPARIDARST
jgi:sugar phosphate isomerase/epimerase